MPAPVIGGPAQHAQTRASEVELILVALHAPLGQHLHIRVELHPAALQKGDPEPQIPQFVNEGNSGRSTTDHDQVIVGLRCAGCMSSVDYHGSEALTQSI